MPDDALEDLRLYVKHLAELRESRFWQKVLSQKNVRVRTVGEGWEKVEFVNVDEEEVRSFLLGARLLIQNNERVSVSNIWKICQGFMGNSAHFPIINAQRWMLNDYLDQNASIADHAGKALTNREILNTFLYGSYAHFNRESEERLKQWQTEPRQYYPLKLMFIMALKVLIQTSGAMSDEIAASLNSKGTAA